MHDSESYRNATATQLCFDVNNRIDDRFMYVKPTPRLGPKAIGIFTRVPCGEDCHICDMPGRIIMPPHKHLSDTCFCYGENIVIECFEPLCYINHSCDPNCYTDTYEHEGRVILALYASRQIWPHEQLCIDYDWDCEGIPCRCGAANCKGWLGIPPKPKKGKKDSKR